MPFDALGLGTGAAIGKMAANDPIVGGLQYVEAYQSKHEPDDRDETGDDFGEPPIV